LLIPVFESVFRLLLCLCCCNDIIESLATDRGGRAGGETTRGDGKDRPIHNAKPINTIDSELGVHAVVSIIGGSHAATARDVVAPRVIPDSLLNRLTRRWLNNLERLIRLAGLVENTQQALDAFRECCDVCLRTFGIEIEVNLWLVAGVGRSEADMAGLLCALLVDDGKEEGFLGPPRSAEAREVTVKYIRCTAKDDQICIVSLSVTRAQKHEDRRRALPIRSVTVIPLSKASILLNSGIGVEKASSHGIIFPRNCCIDMNSGLVVVP
jgi:hypothetical protein